MIGNRINIDDELLFLYKDSVAQSKDVQMPTQHERISGR